ncbi:MAG: hypothetical protein V4686_02905 [Patescibacteria group bacterium]
MIHKTKTLQLGILLTVACFLVTVIHAATTIVVTPTDVQGWSTSDTRPGGAVNYVADVSSPLGDAALQLTTNASTTAKAQYLHAASTSIDDVTDLGYWTKQVSGPAHADASYQLLVLLNGTTSSFTTFVYEPYQQTNPIVPGTWQEWDVEAGQFWSSRSVTAGGACTVVAGGGGAPFYTLAEIKANCPNAVVVGFGVNIGSNNPEFDVYTDGVVFNDTTYDFELVAPDTTAPAAPTPISPANGTTTTTVAQQLIDWSDVTDPSAPVTYIYQSSNSSSTNPDGSFEFPIYTSGPLAVSEIATPGTPEGVYYWHVNATDAAGNTSPWSVAWKITVDNTVVVPPTTPTNKDQCKNDGWKSFTNPSFKNQGQCVSSVAKNQ